MGEYNSRREPQLLDDTFQALADATRREILRLLSQGDKRVTELAANFEISLNSVSKHIRLLERAGLIKRRKAGREHIISLHTQPMDHAAIWLDSQRHLWKARLALLDQLLTAEEATDKNNPTSTDND
jgi:DNA-binding transcriptional ArsR family regulator